MRCRCACGGLRQDAVRRSSRAAAAARPALSCAGVCAATAAAAKRAMRREEEAEFLSRAAQIESDAGDHDAAFASLRTLIRAAAVVDLEALDADIFDLLDEEAATDGLRGDARCLRSGGLLHRGELEAARRCASEAIDLSEGVGDERTAAEARMAQRSTSVSRSVSSWSGISASTRARNCSDTTQDSSRLAAIPVLRRRESFPNEI